MTAGSGTPTEPSHSATAINTGDERLIQVTDRGTRGSARWSLERRPDSDGGAVLNLVRVPSASKGGHEGEVVTAVFESRHWIAHVSIDGTTVAVDD